MTSSSEGIAVYVAPARYVLTVLHRQDPDAGPGKDAEGDPVVGWTVCGLRMGEDELWVPVDGRDGDQLCTGCLPRGGGPVAIEDVEATLW